MGEAGSSIIINTDSLSTLSGTSTISGKLIGAAISGVISVIILQLAISTAKQLSGDIGNRISGKISSFIGNTALGGTARLTRMGASKLVNNKKFNGWISKGGTRGRLALKLQKVQIILLLMSEIIKLLLKQQGTLSAKAQILL